MAETHTGAPMSLEPLGSCVTDEYDDASAPTARRGSKELVNLDHGYGELLRELQQVWPEVPDCQIELSNVTISVESLVEEAYTPTLAKAALKMVGLHSLAGVNTKTQRFSVLQDVNLVFEPGTSTLILAPPGHGKSTVLRLAADQGDLDQSGTVRFNGKTAEETDLNLRQLVAYVAQDDVHMPQLTVRETLQFAHDNSNTPFGLPSNDLIDTYQQNRVSSFIRMLGLEKCAETAVGNDLVRGVSGGEKRRVSIAEMLISNARCFCLDEYSTGLDASTTIDLTDFLTQWVKITNGTLITTLLQPPPEVFALYDNVVILREGCVVYSGPRSEAEGYFASIGYPCPADVDFADFVLEVVTDPSAWVQKQQRLGVDVQTDSKAPPTSTQALVQAFAASRQPIEAAPPPPTVDNEFVRHQYHSIYPRTFAHHLRSCLGRQFKLVARDTQFIAGHIGQSVILALILGSLFWQLDIDDFQLRVGLLLFMPTLLAFNNMAEVPVAIHGKLVVQKQKRAAFYPILAYVFAVNIAHLPLALFEAVVMGTPPYFMSSFVADGGRFVFFILMLFLTGLASATFFRAISYLVPSMEVGQVLIGPSNAICVLFGGVMITRLNVPNFLIWAYYLSPFSWVTQALAINEFESSDYDTLVTQNNETTRIGDSFLEAYEFNNSSSYKWGAVVYLIVVGVLVSFLSAGILRYLTSGIVRGSSRGTSTDEEDEDKVNEAGADTFIVDTSPAGTTFPFMPVRLVFDKLSYEVELKDGTRKMLLNAVSGAAAPGRLMALMGQTGAGKTTLMDVIAGRKTGGQMTGRVLVNGRQRGSDFGHVVGYVEQNDLHDEFATVMEALQFSATLRLPSSVSEAERTQFVQEVLEVLELDQLAGRLVGSLSRGQKKRVTIGVELVANSSVLMCDEPTSNLDSREAQVVMRVIRRVAHTGRTVICTVHQPNEVVFSMFDDLVLLAAGGFVVFNGPVSQLQPYFEAVPGVQPKDPIVNPATWMLDVIGAGVLRDNTQDFPTLYLGSDLERAALAHVAELSVVSSDGTAPGADFDSVSWMTQFVHVLSRLNRTYYRNVDYNFTRIMTFTFLGIFFGIVYQDTDEGDLAGIFSSMAAIFMTSVFAGAIHLLTVLPVVAGFRATLARETASNTYQKLQYSLSMAIVEAPYVLVCSLLFLASFYNLVGFSTEGETLGIYFLGHVLISFVCLFLAQTLAFSLPSAEVATLVGSSILSLCFLFGGLFMPGPDMPRGYRWIWHSLFLKYGLNALIVPQFYCSGLDCPTVTLTTANGTITETASDYVQDYLGLDYEDRWAGIGALGGFAVGFWMLALIASKYFDKITR
eukprot:m.80290 g.80290  ORF g.80290 m.80290 type:complete len:1328 (-) comp14657_c0_seq3:114-4097(-)